MQDFEIIQNVDAIILAVAHREYKILDLSILKEKYLNYENMILMDVKGIVDVTKAKNLNFKLWRL